MAAPDEERDLLYVLRAMQILVDAGSGVESLVTYFSKGGYGAISKDFESMQKGVEQGKRLEDMVRDSIRKTKSDPYRRLLNTILNNITSNTDLSASLAQQAERAEELRTEKLERYVEKVSGIPEKALILSFFVPFCCGLLALIPYIVQEGLPGVAVPDPSVTWMTYYFGMIFTIVTLFFILHRARASDPGV
tara:strand:+ start:60 stop:632 length:573 start_codon:yes stop_codon:yes gene_type:complete